MKKLIVLTALSFILASACAVPPQTASNNSSSASATPDSTAGATNTSASSEKSEMQDSEFRDYKYKYKREGDTVTALFLPRFLPRDDTTIIGAMRDVILSAYKEQTYGQPSLVNAKTESGTLVRAFRFKGVENAFIVIPIKEDTGETHSLTITRIPL